jgi:uncharacterized protein
MARTLTIRGISDAVLERLRARAAAGRRSLNSELLTILEAAAGSPSAEASDSRGKAGAVEEPATGHWAPESADALADVDHAALTDICRHHHIRRLDVFGSVAAGTARPDSDVDVIAEFEPGRTPGFDIVRVAEALRPVFGGRRVDLHTPFEARRLRDRVTSRTLYAAR